MSDDSLSEPELYRSLGALTKDKNRWAESVPYLSSLLSHESVKIQANTPGVYQDSMPVFEKLLHDADDRVRMETPEIFRVLGKRRPEFFRPFLEALRQLSKTDENRVVRIHCLGAIKAKGSK